MLAEMTDFEPEVPVLCDVCRSPMDAFGDETSNPKRVMYTCTCGEWRIDFEHNLKEKIGPNARREATADV